MADIFDRMFQGVSNIGKNSGIFAEKAKINVAIQQQQGQKKQLAEALGMRIYQQMLTTGEVPDEIRGFFDELQKCDNLIKDYEMRIQALEQQYAESQRQAQVSPQPQYQQYPPQYQPQPQYQAPLQYQPQPQYQAPPQYQPPQQEEVPQLNVTPVQEEVPVMAEVPVAEEVLAVEEISVAEENPMQETIPQAEEITPPVIETKAEEPVNAIPPQNERKTCASCGFSNPPQAKFCAKCGTMMN